MLLDDNLGIDVDLTYEDPRYPILRLESEQFGIIGYSLDLSNGELTRVCICNAYHTSECLCGALDYYEREEL